ncbi:MAG: sulfite exporter TauE/SafE family protein [Syntrophobacterales bacterium]|nr:sulfite exporter TauE/SafE family protein [Syntrophobacterales bacterium]
MNKGKSLLIGLVSGAFGGLVGLGGGVIMIPLMTRFYGLNQHQAHGTSLAALVFTGLTGAVTYWLHGSVDVAAAALLAATAIGCASLGALFAHSLPEWQLKGAFGAFLIVVALLLVLKPYYAQYSGSASGWVRVAVLLASGMVAGFFAGLMGVGGGSLMVPAMVLLLGFSQHLAQGTSLLAMVPAGASGAYTHWRLGNVVTGIVPGLILGIMAGTYGGATLAHWLSEASLRVIFAAILIWLGARDLRKSLRLQRSLAEVPTRSR